MLPTDERMGGGVCVCVLLYKPLVSTLFLKYISFLCPTGESSLEPIAEYEKPQPKVRGAICITLCKM